MKTTYKHKVCGAVTTMREALAVALESNPERIASGLRCDGCARVVPAHECVWAELTGRGGVSVTDEPCALERAE